MLTKQKLRNYIVENFMGTQPVIERAEHRDELDDFIETPEKEQLEQVAQVAQEQKYRYLDNDSLSNEFALYREQEILELKKHTLALCMFSMNETMKVPFLEFFFKLNADGAFDFPQTGLAMDTIYHLFKKESPDKINLDNLATFTTTETEPEKNEQDAPVHHDEVEQEFFNQCSQFFQKVTFLSHEIASQRYLGFIEKDDVLYIVFDCTNLDILENIHEQKIEGVYLGIVDEIIHRKKIFETPIETKILDLFISNPQLSYIYGADNNTITLPKLLYLCSEGKDETGKAEFEIEGYKNVYYSEDEIKEMGYSQSPTLSVVYPKVKHPLFDNTYLFSSETLNTGPTKGLMQELVQSLTTGTTHKDDIKTIKRFALNIDSVKYYKDTDMRTLIDKKEKINPNYGCYCFYDNSAEFWAVKTVAIFTEI